MRGAASAEGRTATAGASGLAPGGGGSSSATPERSVETSSGPSDSAADPHTGHGASADRERGTLSQMDDKRRQRVQALAGAHVVDVVDDDHDRRHVRHRRAQARHGTLQRRGVAPRE